uniref:peptide-methionine (S)-S-oxide reductase n=1 Tax=Scleropages formosus TaxID=113540 RepID=A0A8C9QVG7_SCLFO
MVARLPRFFAWRAFIRDMGDMASKTQLPSKETALPGRAAPLRVSEKHHVSGNRTTPPFPEGTQMALFGMGCFWGAERKFWTRKGVYSTQVGYAGGFTPNPTYEETCTGKTGHAEVVRVVFDPAEVTYENLLRVFWENHDPTQGSVTQRPLGCGRTRARDLLGSVGGQIHTLPAARSQKSSGLSSDVPDRHASGSPRLDARLGRSAHPTSRRAPCSGVRGTSDGRRRSLVGRYAAGQRRGHDVPLGHLRLLRGADEASPELQGRVPEGEASRVRALAEAAPFSVALQGFTPPHQECSAKENTLLYLRVH